MKILEGSEIVIPKRLLKNTEKELLSVRKILKSVKEGGDRALLECTKLYDKVDLQHDRLKVSSSCLEKARVSDDLAKALKKAKSQIEAHQKFLLPKSFVRYQSVGSTRLGLRYTPLDRVGVYIPSGSAPLVSTVLMTVLPAKVAGVSSIALVSPPSHNGDIHPSILYASKLCGVNEIYRIGGAQSVGALAYGTESIPSVDKIVGPGNIFVSLAKKEVFSLVDIDSVAGPSEIMIVTDDTAPIDWVVSDLMSQAEHDTLSACYLICSTKSYAERVKELFEKKLLSMPRQDIISKSWADNAFAFVVENIDDAIPIVNAIAPEHLELLCANANDRLLAAVRHAGAIFIGEHSPEALGDYFAGPSHVLPTSGSARFFSPLSAMSFLKTSSLISYDRSTLKEHASAITTIATAEGLEAHADSVRVRFPKKTKLSKQEEGSP